MNYSKKVVPYLIENQITITSAESCTGGLIASSIVAFPGVSVCYREGHITYANEAKEKYLGVYSDTLSQHGAVSVETCREMAIGARKTANSDISIVTTGIAGPDGGSKEKPVGLVYIGLSFNGTTIVRKYHFHGTRTMIRKSACNEAFRLIYDYMIQE